MYNYKVHAIALYVFCLNMCYDQTEHVIQNVNIATSATSKIMFNLLSKVVMFLRISGKELKSFTYSYLKDFYS